MKRGVIAVGLFLLPAAMALPAKAQQPARETRPAATVAPPAPSAQDAEAEMRQHELELQKQLQQLRVRERESQLELQMKRFEQLRALHKSGAVGETELLEAQHAAELAAANLKRAKIEADLETVRARAAEAQVGRLMLARREEERSRAARPEMAQVEYARGYIELVDRYSRLAHDPTNAGVAAAATALDILRRRGSDAAIEYFDGVLPEITNEAVQRAIRFQLVDLYRQNGNHDAALEQLRILMTSAPSGQRSTLPGPGMPPGSPSPRELPPPATVRPPRQAEPPDAAPPPRTRGEPRPPALPGSPPVEEPGR